MSHFEKLKAFLDKSDAAYSVVDTRDLDYCGPFYEKGKENQELFVRMPSKGKSIMVPESRCDNSVVWIFNTDGTLFGTINFLDHVGIISVLNEKTNDPSSETGATIHS